MTKIQASAAQALHDLMADGLTIAVGGFGLSGIPADLIDAVRESGAKDLTIVSNNMGVDGKGARRPHRGGPGPEGHRILCR